MKITPFLAVFVCLNVLICHPARAQDTDTNTADFNFVLVPVDKVLDVYKRITKSELVMLTDIPQEPRWVTLHIVVPREEVPQTVPKLIEQAVLKQAGVVLTRVDEKQVSVAYNKYDTRLDLQRVEHTTPLTIALTSKDVQTNTVRVTSQRGDAPNPNLVFRFANKSSEEIEALISGVNRQPVKIMKDGIVVTEAPSYSGYLDRQHNFVGMVLVFKNSDYDQAKLAEKTLRGE
jgi:hypothetical protein